MLYYVESYLNHKFGLEPQLSGEFEDSYMDLQNAIESRLADQFPDAAFSVEVSGNHAQIAIASSQFEGLTAVKRQQLVYGCLNELIRTGELHAVTIKAKSTEGS